MEFGAILVEICLKGRILGSALYRLIEAGVDSLFGEEGGLLDDALFEVDQFVDLLVAFLHVQLFQKTLPVVQGLIEKVGDAVDCLSQRFAVLQVHFHFLRVVER